MRALVACASGEGQQIADLSRAGIGAGDRPALRRRADVGPAHQYRRHGILALVGRAPVGRGHFRSLRHRDHLAAVRPHGHLADVHGDRDGAVRHDHLPVRRGAWHFPPSVFQRNADLGDRGRGDGLGA